MYTFVWYKYSFGRMWLWPGRIPGGHGMAVVVIPEHGLVVPPGPTMLLQLAHCHESSRFFQSIVSCL